MKKNVLNKAIAAAASLAMAACIVPIDGNAVLNYGIVNGSGLLTASGETFNAQADVLHNGSITFKDSQEAESGSKLYFYATPDPGYAVASVTCCLRSDTSQKVDVNVEDASQNEYSIVMPEGNVNIAAKFEVEGVHIYETEHGDVMASPDSDTPSLIELQLQPELGYKVDTVTVKTADDTSVAFVDPPAGPALYVQGMSVKYFNKPNEEVYVTATFIPCDPITSGGTVVFGENYLFTPATTGTYKFTFAVPEDADYLISGTLRALDDDHIFRSGDNVLFADLTASSSYLLSAAIYARSAMPLSGDPIESNLPELPASTTVTIEKVQKHSITVNPTVNGTIQVMSQSESGNAAAAGELVMIMATPADGFSVKSVTAMDADQNPINFPQPPEASGGGFGLMPYSVYSLEMPDSAITVSAMFMKTLSYNEGKPYVQTATKSGVNYTRYVFVRPIEEIEGKDKAVFTATYRKPIPNSNERETVTGKFETHKYYTGMTTNQTYYEPEEGYVLFVVTITGVPKDDVTNEMLECGLTLESLTE